ncbi:lipoprotein [Rhizocola hellebori]|uniref:Lipoprotein n=1 Tax=Rhizocola hellebori TaxID=1392758 RepID=A0A8J3QGD7_9ACTN|nr:DUF4349 domain-containing protein [Rhizocola hellebori]GIH09215.1 lipoprotein [Rhizocola hellebori]
MGRVGKGMKRIVFAALAVGALLLGGCSANDSAKPTSAEAPGAAPLRENAGGDAQTDQSKAMPPIDGVTATSGPVEGRALIYRGDITVRVEDVEIASGKVESIATKLGGHISSQKRVSGSRDAAASITMRVPSKSFDAAMTEIAGLGKEQSRGSNTEDVTEAIVDLDTRIAAQKASVDSVRKMFERAVALSDVVLLEKELSQRQAELASLEAKKRRLDDLVSLSTITISLAGPNTEIPVEKKRSPGFLGGLEAGWDAFVSSIQVILVVIGFMLPFLVAIAIPIVLYAWLARRKRRLAPAPPPNPGVPPLEG